MRDPPELHAIRVVTCGPDGSYREWSLPSGVRLTEDDVGLGRYHLGAGL